ncbi:MAG: hypothetical protein ACKVZJ_03470 [Phycisphaerales bacterium]
MKTFALSALALVAASSTAFGAFSITNGNATFSSSVTPNFGDTTNQTVDLRPEGGVTQDQAFYYNWSYRPLSAGSTGIRGFSFLESPVVAAAGNTATFTWSNNGPGPVGQSRFSAVLTLVLTDGAIAGQAKVDATMVFTAATSNTGLTSWSLFNGLDFDIQGLANDTAVVTNPTAAEYTQTDVSGIFGKHAGFGANRFQVGSSSPIRGLLTGGGSTNLNNTASFGPGDAAGAFQWDFSLQPGESRSIVTSFLVAPTPGTAGLLGLAGLAGLRRRRA